MAGFDDTIVALSSGRPPAAISVIRTSGPHALSAAAALCGPLPKPRVAALRRFTDPQDGDLIDEGLLIFFPGPASATGENIVEYQCHGGRATVDRLISVLVAQPGCRLALAGEFTRRALANGRIDLTEAEGLADLLAAETELQRRSAMVRAGGALRRKLDDWREQILILSAQAEVAIDYADEDDGAGSAVNRDTLAGLETELANLLSAPAVEPMREGVRVVVAGPPNAGKSSLINALSQSERAIVTDVPGTTRDVIEVPLAISGIPFLMIDTAGLRESDDVVEAIGVERAQREAERADILLWMGSPDDRPANAVQLHGKADLGGARIAEEAFAVSAKTGVGLVELTDMLVKAARSLLPRGDEIALERRQRLLLVEARAAVGRAAALSDPVLVAEELRAARVAIDAISGRAGVEDLLDALFGRFCLGK